MQRLVRLSAKRAGRAYMQGCPVGKAFSGKPLTGQGALAEAKRKAPTLKTPLTGKAPYQEGPPLGRFMGRPLQGKPLPAEHPKTAQSVKNCILSGLQVSAPRRPGRPPTGKGAQTTAGYRRQIPRFRVTNFYLSQPAMLPAGKCGTQFRV